MQTTRVRPFITSQPPETAVARALAGEPLFDQAEDQPPGHAVTILKVTPGGRMLVQDNAGRLAWLDCKELEAIS